MRRRRSRYLPLAWRGIQIARTRIYQGTRSKELVCPDLSFGSPWVGAFTFTVKFKGRQNYRYRTQKPRHARRLGIA